MKLADIAARIDAHLKRFEADQKINRIVETTKGMKLRSYWLAGSWASGNRVYVKYISYQGSSGLKKADALTYLSWLDAGNSGSHRSIGLPASYSSR